MKKMILIIFILIVVANYMEAQNYTAKMRLENLYWYQFMDNSPEWSYDLYADLYLNGVLQTTGEYQYTWWKKIVYYANPDPQ